MGSIFSIDVSLSNFFPLPFTSPLTNNSNNNSVVVSLYEIMSRVYT